MVQRLKFTDTPDLPRKVRLFKPGGAVLKSYGGKPTIKIAPHVWLNDGDIVDAEDYQVAWCLKMYPKNFSLVVPRKAKETKYPEVEPKGE